MPCTWIGARPAHGVDRRMDPFLKGTNGASTNGVTANFIFFDRGPFWVLPLTYFYLPKSARAYLFPQSVNNNYFCSGPISVDPICPQPNQLKGDTVHPQGYHFVPTTTPSNRGSYHAYSMHMRNMGCDVSTRTYYHDRRIASIIKLHTQSADCWTKGCFL